MLSIRHLTRLCCRLWDGMETTGKSEITFRLSRRTLTVGVMAGFMVCTAMVSAQAAAGCPASSCVSQPGQCTLTQSLDTVTIGATVRCAALFPDGVIYSTPNGWARSFNMAAEGLQPGAPQFTTKSVTFGRASRSVSRLSSSPGIS